jgi:hypothetical protein
MRQSSIALVLASAMVASCVLPGGEPPKEADTGDTQPPSLTCYDPYDATGWDSSNPLYDPNVNIRTVINNFSCQPRDPSSLEWSETYQVDLFSFTDSAFLVAEFAGGPIVPMTEPEAESAARDALSLWSNVTGAEIVLTFNAPPAGYDTESSLRAVTNRVSTEAGALAQTTYYTASDENFTADAEIFASYCDALGNVYSAIYVVSSPGPNEFSLIDTMTHEIGHGLGFSESDDPVSIMWQPAQQGQLYFVTSGDEDGLRFIY